LTTGPRDPAQAERTKWRRESLYPALLGLFGVAIGAAITGGFSSFGDRSDQAADKRTAVRLIASEIRVDTNSLTQAARSGM
jgi:hypothetical protein